MTEDMSQIVLPSNKADQKAIMDGMREISNAYFRIAGERDYIKESINALNEKYGVPKKALRKLSRFVHKGDIDKEAAEFEGIREMYDTLTEANTANTQS